MLELATGQFDVDTENVVIRGRLLPMFLICVERIGRVLYLVGFR